MICVMVVWVMLESVTVSATVNDPAVVYVCEAGFPVALLLSPKFQLYEYPPVPPEADATKVTCTPIVGLVETVKLAVIGRATTVTLCEAMDVFALASVIVTETVKVPSVL